MTERSWKVYLASPIDQVDVESVGSLEGGKTLQPFVHEVRAELTETLVAFGATVYDPYNPNIGSLVGRHPELVEHVRAENERMLHDSDAVLAYLPDGVPTIGTPVEIDRALTAGKPIVAVGGHALMSTPLWSGLAKVDADSDEGLHLAVQKLAILSGRIRVMEPHRLNVPTSRPKVTDSGITELDELPLIPTNKGPSPIEREEAFYDLVQGELRRAEAKHPADDPTTAQTSAQWFGVWVEEMLEGIQAWNDLPSHGALSVEQVNGLKAELIQAAAMAFRFWETLP